MKKLFFIFWVLIAICLCVYSFTQVDLSLTLNKSSFVQDIQKSFQYVGYFNRPLSTYFYTAIVAVMFGIYLWTLHLVRKKQLSRKSLWVTILAISGILFVSYNAFSYDIFNYIFDARIITDYHANPYVHKALDYPADPMLSFMRWTHRVYPYGPAWLVLTVPLTFFGTSFFIGTFYLFKALMVGSFIGSVWMIEKIVRQTTKDQRLKTNLPDPLFALAFFAFNPLVIIESLVSAHNDIVMMFVGLVSVYFLFEKKYLKSGIIFLFAGLIKFATFFLAPAFLYYFKTKNTVRFFELSLVLMIVAMAAAIFRTQFQPWYLLLVLPFAAFLSKKYYVLIPSIILSVAALMQYPLFLYNGNWDAPIPQYNLYIMLAGIGISVIGTVLYKITHPKS